MAKYLLIESQDPFESNDTNYFYNLAASLKKEGNDVTLFLLGNGVFPARPGSRSQDLVDLSKAGVEILADDFSLRERGIEEDRLITAVRSAPLSIVIDQLGDGRKTLWH